MAQDAEKDLWQIGSQKALKKFRSCWAAGNLGKDCIHKNIKKIIWDQTYKPIYTFYAHTAFTTTVMMCVWFNNRTHELINAWAQKLEWRTWTLPDAGKGVEGYGTRWLRRLKGLQARPPQARAVWRNQRTSQLTPFGPFRISKVFRVDSVTPSPEIISKGKITFEGLWGFPLLLNSNGDWNYSLWSKNHVLLNVTSKVCREQMLDLLQHGPSRVFLPEYKPVQR